MVAFFCKWFCVSCLALAPAVHPFHVSVTEIHQNVTDKTLEITCKMFTDDFEGVLSRNYKAEADLSSADQHAAMDKWVSDYLLQRLQLKADARVLKLEYLGFERDKESVYAYLQVSGITSFRTVDITNSIMYDYFTDQINITHVIRDGKRQSVRVNYPSDHATVSF